MDVLILLIPLSVVLVLLIGAGFWWSLKSGQFDDLEGPAHRILADDDSAPAAFEHTEPDAERSNPAQPRLTEVKQSNGERP